MELWDAYYADGTPAGRDLVRDEPIPEGLYHMVAEIVVRHEDGSHLLMQRDPAKKVYPGLYEASAGGGVIKGETALEGAFRELREETGIIADVLEPIYKVVQENCIFCGFLCVTNCPKDSVLLQQGETVSYIWLDKEDFISFLDSPRYIKAHRNILAAHYLGTLK